MQVVGIRSAVLAAAVLAGVSPLFVPGASAGEQEQEIDPALTPYAKVSGEVAGSIKCVGSDTMNNLVALWAEGFKKSYPSVQ